MSLSARLLLVGNTNDVVVMSHVGVWRNSWTFSWTWSSSMFVNFTFTGLHWLITLLFLLVCSVWSPKGPRYSNSSKACTVLSLSITHSSSLTLALKLILRCTLPVFLSPPYSCWKHFSSSSIFTSWSQTPTHLQTHLHETRTLQCTNTLCSQTCTRTLNL